MSEEREALKGKLLLLWLEDLKNDKKPGLYQEMKSFTPKDVEEVMSLARFMKGNLYPNENMPVDVDNYAKELAKLVFKERNDQFEFNRAAIQKSATFSELVANTIELLGIDKTALQRALTLPRATLSDLELEEMPPHRLPLDTMVRLLVALRLASKEVVELIRKSSNDWALKVYSCGQTQLGRIDISLSGNERRELMKDQGNLDREFDRIAHYCSRLSTALLTIKPDPDSKGSHLADGETWLPR